MIWKCQNWAKNHFKKSERIKEKGFRKKYNHQFKLVKICNKIFEETY